MSLQLPMIVIGAGPAGLSAATLLARAGKRVFIFDAARVPGGRARSEHDDGYTVNLGAHALYCGGPAERVLAELGVSVGGQAPLFKSARALLRDELVPLPTSTSGLVGAGWLGLRGRYQLLRTLWRMSRVDRTTIAGEAFAQWLHTQVSDPQARLLLEALSRLVSYSNAPEQVSADAMLEQLTNATARGVRYLDGGWQSMVDGLTQACTAAGVETRCGCAVRAVEHRGQHVTGVRLANGSRVDAQAVLIATSPAGEAELLPDMPASVEAAALSVRSRAVCLDVALTDAKVTADFVLGLDAPVYGSVHSHFSAIAPEGGTVIQLARYVRPAETIDTAAVRNELEALLARMVAPGAKRVFERFRPNMTVQHGIPLASRGGLAGRAGIRHEAVRGVYRAGDWVGPAPFLVDAAFASAKLAATAMIEDQASLSPKSGILERGGAAA